MEHVGRFIHTMGLYVRDRELCLREFVKSLMDRLRSLLREFVKSLVSVWCTKGVC